MQALVSDEFVSEASEHYKLVFLQVTSQTGEVPHAVIALSDGDDENGLKLMVAVLLMRPLKLLKISLIVKQNCYFILSTILRAVRTH